jgi:hypothetical protein
MLHLSISKTGRAQGSVPAGHLSPEGGNNMEIIKNIHGCFPDKKTYELWCKAVGVKPANIHIHKKEDPEVLMHTTYDVRKRRRLK